MQKIKRKWRSNADTREKEHRDPRRRQLERVEINRRIAARMRGLAGAEKYADSLTDCMVTTHTQLCMDESCLHPTQAVTHCKQRLCAHCAPIKAKDQARGVRKLVSMFKTTRRESRPDRAKYSAPKFITLTMRTRGTGELSAALDELHRAWRNFKRIPYIKNRIHGGVICTEIVGSQAGKNSQGKEMADRWHVHLHLLADAEYIPGPVLSKLWGEALRQKGADGAWYARTDIKAVSGDELARYVSKYTAKPADVDRWTDSQLREFVTTIKKRRLVSTFGAYYRLGIIRLSNQDKPEGTKRACIECGKTGTLFPARAGPRHYGEQWRYFLQKSFSDWGVWYFKYQNGAFCEWLGIVSGAPILQEKPEETGEYPDLSGLPWLNKTENEGKNDAF